MRIARLVWVSLLLAACRGGASQPSYPPLDPEPTPASPPTALADELAPLPATDPAYDPALGTPPPSKPQGAPVAITLRQPQVGDVRTRALRMRNVIDNELEARKFRQLSSNRYELREELAKIEGDALVIKVHVDHATEAVMLKDQPHSVTTASGEYVITSPAPGEPAQVARPDGAELGGREVEELSDLFGFDTARPHPLAQIASKRPLRAGESVQMTPAENMLFGGGREVLAPVHLTLLDASAKTARYQADVMLQFAAKHERRLRYWVTLERATGRLVELHELMHDRQTDETLRQEQVQHLAMTVGYP